MKAKRPLKVKVPAKFNSKASSAMRDDALDNMTVKELKELLVSTDRHIAAKQADERNALREKLREMAEDAGFTVADILGSSTKGRPAATKYINPDNPSETWSGRGRQPRWMVARLKLGGKQEDFAI